MAHNFYAREGNVVLRFPSKSDRDAWVAHEPSTRTVLPGVHVSIRLQYSGVDGDLVLRDAPAARPRRR